MTHVLLEIFGWPAGIIIGNLLASVVWSSVFEWRLHKHHGKLHAKIDELHAKVDALSTGDTSPS